MRLWLTWDFVCLLAFKDIIMKLRWPTLDDQREAACRPETVELTNS